MLTRQQSSKGLIAFRVFHTINYKLLVLIVAVDPGTTICVRGVWPRRIGAQD